jgi:hypothetical protein
VLDAGGFGRIDHVLVLSRAPAHLTGRYQQKPVQAGDRRVERGPVFIGRHPDLDALARQVRSLGRVAHDGDDVRRRTLADQLLHHQTAQLPACPSHSYLHVAGLAF